MPFVTFGVVVFVQFINRWCHLLLLALLPFVQFIYRGAVYYFWRCCILCNLYTGVPFIAFGAVPFYAIYIPVLQCGSFGVVPLCSI